MLLDVRIQEEDFSLQDEIEKLTQNNKNCGAIVSFLGLVREEGIDGEVLSHLELEHYPGMSEKKIRDHAQNANERWPLLALTIIHRVGSLKVGEQIVSVIAAAEHRGSAFEAAEFLMDYLKTDAPFWKKQVTASQSSAWIETGEDNLKRLTKWK